MAYLSVLIAIVTFGTACGQNNALKDAIQKGMDSTLDRYRSQYPNLALSVAWRDGTRDISLAVGNVSGRALTPQDTFLYGSGTKPITAAAVLRLIDQGKIKATDKVSSIVDPYLKAHGRPPLAAVFGDEINNATVLQLIRMNAGIRDFEDSYDLDKRVLSDGTEFWNIPFDAMNFSVSQKNIQAGLHYKGVGNGPLYCKPGSCTAYSSTSFEIAGLVLASVLQPSRKWFEFDLGDAVFEDRTAYPSLSFPNGLPGKAISPSQESILSKYLTIPGRSVSKTWPTATIYKQNPSILGFTCGNMVASPRDVAKFYYHLLDSDVAHADPKPLISDQARAEMTNFQEFSRGWCANDMKYAAGMMQIDYGHKAADDGAPHDVASPQDVDETMSRRRKRHHKADTRVSVIGHEGDTYGFVSSQGYVPALKGAYSVVANVDHSAPMEHLAGYVLAAAKQHIGGANSNSLHEDLDYDLWLSKSDERSEPQMMIV